MALPWIKVYATLPRHPKSRRLERILKKRRAWTHVLQLWLEASEWWPSGDLSREDNQQIAWAAGWTGDAARFVDALREAGFLDDDGTLHGWDEKQGAHVEAAEEADEAEEDKAARRREQDRKRKAEKRKSAPVSADVPPSEADIPHESADKCGHEADTKRTGSDTKRTNAEKSALYAGAREDGEKDEDEDADRKEPLSGSSPDTRPPAYAELDPTTDEIKPGEKPITEGQPALFGNTTPPKAKQADAVAEVWEHYRTTVSPRSALTDDRKRLIAKWLAPRGPYTVADLKRAIDGYAKSKHHNGENSTGTKYLSLELFFRDAEHIENGWKYLDANARPSRPANPNAPETRQFAEKFAALKAAGKLESPDLGPDYKDPFAPTDGATR